MPRENKRSSRLRLVGIGEVAHGLDAPWRYRADVVEGLRRAGERVAVLCEQLDPFVAPFRSGKAETRVYGVDVQVLDHPQLHPLLGPRTEVLDMAKEHEGRWNAEKDTAGRGRLRNELNALLIARMCRMLRAQGVTVAVYMAHNEHVGYFRDEDTGYEGDGRVLRRVLPASIEYRSVATWCEKGYHYWNVNLPRRRLPELGAFERPEDSEHDEVVKLPSEMYRKRPLRR